MITATDYDRFSVVTFAPPDIREAVDALRRQLPPSGRPIMAAHVTIKGTFVDPVDLDEITEVIRGACAEAAPFDVTTSHVHTFSGPDAGGVALLVEPSDAFLALHRRLVEDLHTHCRTIYDMELTNTFRPHLTIVQQIPIGLVAGSRSLVEAAQSRYTFPATEAVLVGRRIGQAWESLRAMQIGLQ